MQKIIKHLKTAMEDYRRAIDNRVAGAVAASDLIQRINNIIEVYSADVSVRDYVSEQSPDKIPEIIIFEPRFRGEKDPAIVIGTPADMDVIYFVWDEEGSIEFKDDTWSPIDVQFQQDSKQIKIIKKKLLQSELDELNRAYNSMDDQIKKFEQKKLAIKKQIEEFEEHIDS